MKTLKACAFAAVTMALGGCAGMQGKGGPATAEKTDKAEAQLCHDMSEKDALIKRFPSVDSLSPLSAVRDAGDEVHAAVEMVAGAKEEVRNPNLAAVEAANERLQQILSEVPEESGTVGEAAGTITRDAEDLQIAWDRLYTGLQCGT